MRCAWCLLVPLLLAQTGCDTTFPNEEMDVAGSAKPRPFAIVCEPPEAAPGETVTVTLHYYDPAPEPCAVTWRVALDYDLGLYEADEVERDIVDLDPLVNPIQSDAFGFCSQAFVYTIPDDALLRASSLPDEITDPATQALIRRLMLMEEGETVTKEIADIFLDRIRGPNWRSYYSQDTALAIEQLGDLFACEIRFRASLDGAIRLDVTKNLTVRYSSNMWNPNTNTVPQITSTYVQAVPHPDVNYDDIGVYADEITTYGLTSNGWSGDLTEIPLHAGWTYYLIGNVLLQDYTSPFDAELRQEDASLHWYHFDLDDPGSGRPLFVQDDGGEAEMGDLDSSVRLSPPARTGTLGFRVTTCARDERLEWNGYAFAPGADLVYSEFVFVEP